MNCWSLNYRGRLRPELDDELLELDDELELERGKSYWSCWNEAGRGKSIDEAWGTLLMSATLAI